MTRTRRNGSQLPFPPTPKQAKVRYAPKGGQVKHLASLDRDGDRGRFSEARVPVQVRVAPDGNGGQGWVTAREWHRLSFREAITAERLRGAGNNAPVDRRVVRAIVIGIKETHLPRRVDGKRLDAQARSDVRKCGKGNRSIVGAKCRGKGQRQGKADSLRSTFDPSSINRMFSNPS